MSSLTPELKAKLKRQPQAVVHLIVRTKDAPDTHVAETQTRGFIVHRTFALISALAVEGPASAALTLANEKWVSSIEEDKPVHTLK